MNMAASSSYRAAADPPERDDEPAVPADFDTWEDWTAYLRDLDAKPTEADWAALDRARDAADAAD